MTPSHPISYPRAFVLPRGSHSAPPSVSAIALQAFKIASRAAEEQRLKSRQKLFELYRYWAMSTFSEEKNYEQAHVFIIKYIADVYVRAYCGVDSSEVESLEKFLSHIPLGPKCCGRAAFYRKDRERHRFYSTQSFKTVAEKCYANEFLKGYAQAEHEA